MIDIGAIDAWIIFGASLGTVIVSGAVIGRWCWVRWFRPLIETLTAAADLIQAQLNPNGGGSLMDKVNRIAPNHAEAQHHWTTIEKRLDEGDKRFATLEAAIKEHLP